MVAICGMCQKEKRIFDQTYGLLCKRCLARFRVEARYVMNAMTVTRFRWHIGLWVARRQEEIRLHELAKKDTDHPSSL